MSAPCPNCGASTVSTERSCPNCGMDLLTARRTMTANIAPPPTESFVERYRGTPWETALPPAQPAEPTSWRGLIFLVGLALVLVAVILASKAHLLDIGLNPFVALPVALFVPIFAGWVSKLVPGTKARGPFKSYFVAYIGTSILGLVLILANAWTYVPPTIPIRLSWIVDQLPLEIAGATLFRLVLLAIEG
jgi:hypothetical protein